MVLNFSIEPGFGYDVLRRAMIWIWCIKTCNGSVVLKHDADMMHDVQKKGSQDLMLIGRCFEITSSHGTM